MPCICWMSCHPAISQNYSSRNNYTGDWEMSSSWNPTWSEPLKSISGEDVIINGYITANSSISFTGTASVLEISDTLVIKGNLTLDNNNDLKIDNNGILIIRGNLTINNQTEINAEGYLIVTGDIIKSSSINQGSFTSNDNPVKVFIGGTVTSPGLTDNNPDYPALNCSAPPTDPYPNSACSYGNMTDIINDPVFTFFQSTCTISSVYSNSPLCSGDDLQLGATGGTSYSWSGPNGFTSKDQNPVIPNTNIAQTGAYTVIVTAVSGCTVQATTSVIVNARPDKPGITAGGPTTFCTGGSVTLTSSAGTSYSWSNGAVTPSINVTTPGNYAVRVTDAIGCQSEVSSPAVVNVDDLPIVDAGTDITITNGTSTTINASVTGTGPFVYSWSPSGQLANASIEDPTTVLLTTTTVFVLTATSSTTSCSSTDDVTIMVIGGPLSSNPTASPETVCAGDGIRLHAMAGGGSGSYTYTWTSTPAGFTSASMNPDVNPAVSTTYHVAVFDGFSTVNAQVVANVNAIPVMPTITANGPTTFCVGGSVTLTSSAGLAYLWSTGESNPSITVTTEGIYTVRVTDAIGCQSLSSAPASIIINKLPAVNITSSNSAMCINNVRMLTGSPAGGTFMITEGPGNITGNSLSATGTGNIGLKYSYTDACANEDTQSILVIERPVAIPGPDQELSFVFETLMNAELSDSETGEWSLVSGSGQMSDSHSPASRVTDLSVGENIFLWKVWNGGCAASADVKIMVYDLFVPSVITPNEDGKNDFFIISKGLGEASLIIFNRWGLVEFTSNNYMNDWDGRKNNGEMLPEDTYFYVVKSRNGNVIKGSVLIKR